MGYIVAQFISPVLYLHGYTLHKMDAEVLECCFKRYELFFITTFQIFVLNLFVLYYSILILL